MCTGGRQQRNRATIDGATGLERGAAKLSTHLNAQLVFRSAELHQVLSVLEVIEAKQAAEAILALVGAIHPSSMLQIACAGVAFPSEAHASWE